MSLKVSKTECHYAVIGEDQSDVETIRSLIKNVTKDSRVRIKTKGYGGCGELLRKGARQIELFSGLGCDRFVVCHDADRQEPKDVHGLVYRRIVAPTGLKKSCCIVVPVQEIEAWILADIAKVSVVVPSWRPSEILWPETIQDPKEYLERLSLSEKRRPRYDHATHNQVVAQHLDHELLLKKCPSFEPLYRFLTHNDDSN